MSILTLPRSTYQLLQVARADNLRRSGWTWRRTPDELRTLLPVLDAVAQDERTLMHERVSARFMAEDARITLGAIANGVTAPASALR